MRRLAIAPIVASLLAALPAPAVANGRAPLTNGVFLRPGDDQSLYVCTTFGLLISHDDGCTFHWVCEKAIGYGGEFDPKYAIATDGTIFATTFTGLRVSREHGCTWTTATAEAPVTDPGRIADIWIDAIDISPNGDVWVATAESAKPNDVFRKKRRRRSFKLQSDGVRLTSLAWVVPSDVAMSSASAIPRFVSIPRASTRSSISRARSV